MRAIRSPIAKQVPQEGSAAEPIGFWRPARRGASELPELLGKFLEHSDLPGVIQVVLDEAVQQEIGVMVLSRNRRV